MHTMRRRGLAAAASAGASDSSQGKASDTPAAWRKLRRSSFMVKSSPVWLFSGARVRASLSRSRLRTLESNLVADRVRQRPQDSAVLQEDSLDAREPVGVNAVG